MPAAIVELWGNIAALGGTRIDPITQLEEECYADAQLDGRGALSITVPSDVYWRSDAERQRVLRVTTDLDGTSEWRITKIEDGAGEGSETITITAEPIHFDLRSVPIYQVVAGLPTYTFSLSLTAQQWLENYLVPAVTAWYGVPWVQVGTIESSKVVPLQLDGWTAAELVDALTAATSLEFSFRRIGNTAYAIDLLQQVGSGGPTVDCTVDRNLRQLERERVLGDLATIIIARGGVPNGGAERATMARAKWKVTAISSGLLTLADPAGGADPFPQDDMLNTRYALRPDGVLTEVLDTIAPNRVRVADDTNIAVGDYIEFRADASGNYLTELRDPVRAALPPAGRGPIVGYIDDDELRGEANEVRNPFASVWTYTGDVLYCTIGTTGVHVDTVQLAGLTAYAGQPIPAGSVVWVQGSQAAAAEVVTGGTISGGGTVTLTLDQPYSTTATALAVVYRHGALPEGWTREARAIVQRVVRDGQTLTGTVNGNQTSRELALSLPGQASGSINAGSILQVGTLPPMYIEADATVSGSGAVTVKIGAARTVTNGAPVTITPPQLPAAGGPNGILLPSVYVPTPNPALGQTDDVGRNGVRTPSATIRYSDATPTMWVRAGFTLLSPTTVTLDAGGALLPPSIALIDTATGNTLASAYAAGRTLEAGVAVEEELQLPYDMTGDMSIAVGIAGCRSRVVRQPGAPATMAAWVMVHLGPDPDVPPIDGSHGTRIWQRGATGLQRYSRDLNIYSIRLRNLAAVPGYNAADERLVLGAWVRLVDSSLGVNTLARIVGIRHDLLNPENTTIVLDSTGARITQQLGGGRASAVNVQPVELAGAAGVTGSEDVLGALAALVASIKQPQQQSGVSGPPTQQYSSMEIRDAQGVIVLLDTIAAILQGVEVGNDVTNAVGGLLANAFCKLLAADPDNLDSIPNGLVYNKALNAYVDANGRVYALRDDEQAEDDSVANIRALLAYEVGVRR